MNSSALTGTPIYADEVTDNIQTAYFSAAQRADAAEGAAGDALAGEAVTQGVHAMDEVLRDGP